MSEEITRKEPMPVPPKSKLVTWVSVAIVVIGAVLEALNQIGAIFPGSPWVGKAVILCGVGLKALHTFLAFLNGERIDALAEKKAKELSAKDAADKLGKP